MLLPRLERLAWRGHRHDSPSLNDAQITAAGPWKPPHLEKSALGERCSFNPAGNHRAMSRSWIVSGRRTRAMIAGPLRRLSRRWRPPAVDYAHRSHDETCARVSGLAC